ncbi:chromosome segregation protein sudA [Nadsonia fulvescens var. elongata DSM 6958]|uniref:Structural maintenance of chromosomes protein n=1 Tax=Nadsonia fulvescens var. elongata DSM 6958 TaxID=857566 RepID=A0A1E3PLP0_9ASCO|nr:chromosome segregation protein sudA [Nadsonia fulvescens var. elongata DSM 6958]
MFIKQINIQGFKSFKNLTEIDPFSSGLNVVVGRNGSGKSNFFASVRFVLSDAYTHMSREERQGLLHEGSGSAVMSAYVEIIFDNSDRRFPTGQDTVRIRRTIGLKKDEYALDGKSAAKSEILSFLEAAGFSRSNPYYIVPQGRITALTNAQDAERLELLKEVAGTQVYEQRRSDSLKLMAETRIKRDKILELLANINDRLADLEQEKKELKTYQSLDRERRCLDFTLHDRELAEINLTLDTLEEHYSTGVEANNLNIEAFNQHDETIQQLESEIASAKQTAKRLELDRARYDDDLKALLRSQAQFELRATELQQRLNLDAGSTEHRQHELQLVQSLIATRRAQIDDLLPEFQHLQNQESQQRDLVSSRELQQQQLYAKQGRHARFSTRQERDEWLTTEIADLDALIVERGNLTDQMDHTVQDLVAEKVALAAEVQVTKSRAASDEVTLQEIKTQLATQRQQHESLLDQRKELWREEAKVDSTRDQLIHDTLAKAERQLANTMDRAQNTGLASVTRIAQQLGLADVVYGPLCDLINVDDKYKLAVEVTAGNGLFHVVVDTDDTASKLMDQLNREKAGRVTFMPLNRLSSRTYQYPDNSSETIPLINKVRHDDRFSTAVQQVFARTIVCLNLDTGLQYAASHHLNAITLQGDRVDPRGILSGGYFDTRRSRLDAVKTVKTVLGQVAELDIMAHDLKERIEAQDHQITTVISAINKLTTRRDKLLNASLPLRDHLHKTTQSLTATEAVYQQRLDQLNESRAVMAGLEAQRTALQKELTQELGDTLSTEELELLHDLNTSLPTLRKELAQVATARLELQQKKSLLEVELAQNLYLKRDQLESQLLSPNRHDGGDDSDDDDNNGVEGRGGNEDITTVQNLLDKANHKIEQTRTLIQGLDTQMDQTARELVRLDKELAQQIDQRQAIARKMAKYRKSMEKGLAKRSILSERKDEIQRKIRDLGVLPEKAFKDYAGMDSDHVLKKLHGVTEKLKKFSHVNKKAFEQFTNFAKQRDSLIERRTELEQSEVSINELIDTLDQRKNDAIQRTFKQVSKNFAEIFVKLVPAGTGRLIIQRRMNDNTHDQDASDDESFVETQGQTSALESYIGVAISVSFNSKNDDQQRIEQLSGGQKSLCALALIFAIQQCDPAPFYLFDEIDANLDAQYRTAVANMIHELSRSQKGQFICTTFRNEMIHVADKFYGVLFNNKISSVASISQEDALSFVEDQQHR